MTAVGTGRVYTITVLPPALGTVGKTWLNANDRIHWSEKAKLTKGWRFNTYAALLVHPDDPILTLARAHVVATLHFGDNRRRDVGNYAPTVKAVVDGLVDGWVLPDDNDDHLIGPDLRRGDSNGEPRIVLTVTEVPS
jgi:crossover junction endodeoxyribonuclease RusA